jgi:hypothetical protein
MASIKVTFKEEKEQVIKGTPKVPISKSKKLSSMDGETSLFYIETETAYKLKIDSRVDFTQQHPQNSNYYLITIPIERI